MAISDELFKAILAMDAYNRGYGSVFTLTGNAIGNATYRGDTLPEGSQDVSFSAATYDWGTQKVIAYRGTDALADPLFGWPVALGEYWGPQVIMAARVYQDLCQSSNVGANDILLIGHSLGGGLAGLIGGIYGSSATIFDNMPYYNALSNFWSDTMSGANPTLREGFSLGSVLPQQIVAQTDGYYVEGEALQYVRGSGYPITELSCPGSLSPVQLHDIRLLIMLQYAQEMGMSDWEKIADPFLNALFDDALASCIGSDLTRDSLGMRTAIAYSAIDEGAKVFGDTGIRAMFDDANELGKVLTADASSILQSSADTIVKLLVQFAGQLALGKVEDTEEALKGVLALSEDTQTLAVDFSDNLWDLGNLNGINIIAREFLKGVILEQAGWSSTNGAEPPVAIRTAMKWLWNNSTADIIDRVVFATREGSLNTTIANRNYNSTKVTLFAASNENDSTTGSSDRDYIYGAAGADFIQGGDGDDLLAGGEGDDVLCGGDGRDFLAGGDGDDIIYYALAASDQVKLRFKSIKGDATGDETTLELDGGNGDIDRVIQIEKVELTSNSDELMISQKVDDLGFKIVFDGGSQEAGADVLDFSHAVSSVYIDYARNHILGVGDALGISPAPYSVEVYQDYDPILQWVQRIYNAILPSGDPSGQGAYNGTGLRFANFEHVIGSGQNDVLDLWRLSPGGVLTAEQRAQFNAAMVGSISMGSAPSAIGAFFDNLMEKARAIPQNQVDVTIEAGAGDDIVRGTETGANRIYGGAGNDNIYAGGFTSEIHGGEGDDYLHGGGFKSNLYGGGGKDTFDLTAQTFVMDADTDDHAKWGGVLSLTGGVQQWWMENGWAYWSPFSSIMAALPGLGGAVFCNVWGALGIMVDIPCMLTARYGMTSSNQLVIQFFRGRAGQGVIENYRIDTETGESTANIAVFRQYYREGVGTVEDFANYINLAMKAGFGVCFKGTDPLVLDLDGDGVELTRQEQGVYFDLDKDGFAERTAWVKGDDALLARDINNNGKIDDIGELFGNAATSGFVHLKEMDDNNDNKISALDTAFNTLRVWQDKNGNGITDEGELKTLAEMGISDISLVTSTPADGVVRGNTIRTEAIFTRTDGTTSAISDVLLENNKTDSIYLGDSTVSAEAAMLPKLKGYGIVTNLDIAMTKDLVLLSKVSSLKIMPDTTTWDQIKNATTDILFRWTGVDGIPAVALGEGGFNQQQLAFLEKYFGYQMTPRDGEGKPYLNKNLTELVNSWNGVLDKATLRLAAQGPLSDVFSGIIYDVVTDSFLSTTTTSLADLYASIIGQLAIMPDTALNQWNNNWVPLLAELDDSLYRIDGIEVKKDYVIQSLIRALDGITSPLTMQELVNGLGMAGVHLGTVGDDTLSRGTESGLKVYVGGSGNDTLNGGTGQDVYVYGRNFGQDVINDTEKNESGDRVRLACFGPQDITLKRVGFDLVIGIKGATDTITVTGHFDTPLIDFSGLPMAPNRAIEEIQFADGTIYEAGDISAAVGLGTDGNDVIEGVGTIDELEGLKGDDLLKGSDNGDTYYFTKGDGNDTIQDVMTNSLLVAPDCLVLLGGIQAENIRLSRAGASDDLMINFATGSDSILLKDQFYYTSLGYTSKYALNNRIEAVFFQQGNGLSWLDLQTATIATYTTSGDDATYGFGTPDHFYASAGNDTLVGFDGGDTYSFGRDSGQDIIYEQTRYPNVSDGLFGGMLDNVGYSWGADDTLVFDEGILPTDVTFKRTGEAPDLLISINGTTDTLTIKDQFEAVKLDLCNLFGIAWFDRVEKFKFADGTVLTWEDILNIVTTGTAESENLYGAMYDDRLDGKEGNDYLSGGDGSDIYDFGRGYGQDIIEDKREIIIVESKDAVKFGTDILVSDIEFKHDGNTEDLLISIKGTTDTLRIKNQYDIVETGVFGTQEFNQIENFVWADGTSKTWATLAQEIITAAQTAGDDLIRGTHFDDTIIGGVGNDRFEGGNGADTYIFNHGNGSVVISDFWDNILSGNGDKVAFGDNILPSDIRIDRYGANFENVRFTIAGTMDSISIEGQFQDSTINWRPYEVEAFTFQDGTTWTAADLRNQYLLQQQTAGDDTITGFWFPDTYRFTAGFGNDVIVETTGLVTSDDAASDTIEFGTGITAANTILGRSGNDLVFTFAVSTDKLTIKDQFNHYAWFTGWNDVEIFKFDDGTIWSDKEVREKLVQQARTNGDDSIVGFFTSDVIDGGAGNDTLSGLGGGDTYIFGKGYGQDVIEESCTVYEDYPDTISFLANVVPSEVNFLKVGDDLSISITGVSDTLTIKNHFGSNYSMVEFFEFADGSILTAAQVAVGAIQAQSTAGNDVITGTDEADMIDGGPGNDSLRGSDGNDTYHFNLGFGQDVIEETVSNVMIDDNDRVVFGAGLTSDRAILSRINDDLIFKFQGTTDQLTIKGQFSHEAWFSGWSDIETFNFADGIQWTDAMVRQRLIVQSQTTGDDIIAGFWTDEVFDGGSGNDTLRGFGGGDTYIFGKGSGQDLIEESCKAYEDQQDTISFLPNVIGTEVNFLKVGNNLKISITDTNDTLTIKNHFATAENSVELFTYADGSTLSKAEVNARAIQAQSTIGNDMIVGTYCSDTINDLGGNDTIRGGDGADVYNFASGFGQDVIEETVSNVGISDDDLVVFSGTGLTSDKASLSRINDDLIVKFQGTTDQITIKGQFSHGAWYPGWNDIETFRFADGVQWTEAEVREILTKQSETSGNDTITGFWTHDVINGGAGNDTLRGLGGGDTYIFGKGSGQDVIEEDIGGNVYDDYPDTISFLPNVMRADVTFFKTGNDLEILIVDTTDALVVKNHFGSSYNRVETFSFVDGFMLTAEDVSALVAFKSTNEADVLYGTNQQNYINGGAGNDALYGMGGNDTLDGGAGNDILDGGLGGDTMIGGLGDDTYVVDNATDVATELVNEGVDFIQSTVTYTLGANLENLTLTGSAAINATGNELDNILTGNSGINELSGGLGNDTYVVGNIGDIVAENAGEGIDTVKSSVTYTLGSNLENLTLTGNSNINGTGNELDNLLIGNSYSNTLTSGAGNDILDGSAGADTLIGDAGDDIFIVDNASDSVAENVGEGNDTVKSSITYTLGANLENLTLTGTTAINGTGNEFDNVILGNSGINLIDGGLGADIMAGGQGNDIYVVDSVGDMVTENVGEGTDAVKSSITHTLGANLENLTLIGTTVIDGIGNELNNTLTGNGGDNVLDGGAGVDLMVGGLGSDTYVVDNTSDVVTENLGEGTDMIQSSVTYTLGANVENLALTGTLNINGTGNTLNNTLNGNNGDNVLDGKAGADIMLGGVGNDIYVVDNSGDVVAENSGEGADTVQSSITYTLGDNVENLTLTGTSAIDGIGNNLNNVIYGNTGANTLNGGLGSDTLIGGAGNDVLAGGQGDDVYNWGIGSGHDVINNNISSASETNYEASGQDIVQLGAGITTNSIQWLRSGDDAILKITATGETLTFKGWFIRDDFQVAEIRLDDGPVITAAEVTDILADQSGNTTAMYGTTGSDYIFGENGRNNAIYGLEGNDFIYAGDGDDILDGGAGNDDLRGGIGNDTFVWGQGVGNDTINAGYRGAHGQATVKLGAGLTIDSLDYQILGSNLVLKNKTTGETLTMSGWFSSVNNQIQSFQFADGSSYTGKQISDRAVTYGTTGTDYIFSMVGRDNIIDGMGGNDFVYGGSGNDTFIWGGGSGNDFVKAGHAGANGQDTVKLGEGLTIDSLDYLVSGNNLVLKNKTTAETLTLYEWYSNGINQVQNFQFADGSSYTGKQISDRAVTYGTTGTDYIFSMVGRDNIIDGMGGNDFVYGGSGNDTFIWGEGSGNDFVKAGHAGANGQDTVKLGEGLTIDSLDYLVSGNNLVLKNKTTAETLTLYEWYSNGINQVQNFQFADGSSYTGKQISDRAVTYGTTGTDYIFSMVGRDNIIDGMGGNDFVYGGSGNDTFIWGEGSGNDFVKAGHAGANGQDTVKLGEGLTIDSLDYLVSGNNLVLKNKTTAETLTLYEWYSNGINQVQNFQFADGSSYTGKQISDRAVTYGTTGTDNIYGINGRNNTIYGLEGNDYLYGGNINDILDGGAGNDALKGGLGDDTYIFGVGSGNDTINSYEGAADNGVDTLQFQNLVLASIEFTRNNNDLVCTISQTGENIRLINWTLGTNYQVDQAQFTDGTLTAEQISQRIA